MDKFGRNYNLFIDTADGETLRITPPLTLEFDISRKILGSANRGSLRIYNLSKDNRNNIRFNMYNYTQFRAVKLYAGYGSNLALIFQGNITEAWSQREGINFITQVESFDCGFAYAKSQSSFTPSSGTNQVDIIKQLVNDMTQVDPNTSVGSISSGYSANISRANPQVGNSADRINDIAGNGFFIDNGRVNCLQDNECLKGTISEISAESGLLGTPLLEQSILHFDMVFQPNLVVGQLISLKSSTEDYFNGSYKITSIAHRGMISDAVCGEVITSVGCLTGLGALQLVGAA